MFLFPPIPRRNRSTPFDEFFFFFNTKKLERSGLNISPGRVYGAPHGIPGISPVDARSQRGHPYTVPCRSCADTATTWGSCTGPGISRTLAVVRTAPCLRDMKKREKKKRVLFRYHLSLKVLISLNVHAQNDTILERSSLSYRKREIRFSHRSRVTGFNQFPRKKKKEKKREKKKSLTPLLEIQSLILVIANK